MLVTNVGGLAAMVPHNIVGLVAEPNPESLASNILQYFSQPNRHFIENIVSEKKKYSWQKMTQQIIEMADKL